MGCQLLTRTCSVLKLEGSSLQQSSGNTQDKSGLRRSLSHGAGGCIHPELCSIWCSLRELIASECGSPLLLVAGSGSSEKVKLVTTIQAQIETFAALFCESAGVFRQKRRRKARSTIGDKIIT